MLTGNLKSALMLLPLLVIVQVVLGIVTLLNSLGQIPLVYGVLHQLFAVLLLTDVVFIAFSLSRQAIRKKDDLADEMVRQQLIIEMHKE